MRSIYFCGILLFTFVTFIISFSPVLAITCNNGQYDVGGTCVNCPSNYFGINCTTLCHCNGTSVCDNFGNGCYSGCQPEYYEIGCSRRRPQMVLAPTVTFDCTGISVQFRAFDSTLGDLGTSSITTYRLIARLNSSILLTNNTVPVTNSVQKIYTLPLLGYTKNLFYEFSIQPIVKDDSGNDVNGIYTNFSLPIQPLCLELDNVRAISIDNGFNITWDLRNDSDITTVNANYKAISIGDCQPLINETTISATTSYSKQFITVLTNRSWTQYDVTLNGISLTGSTGPIYSLTVTTADAPPLASSGGISFLNISSSSFQINWSAPKCEQRLGALVTYNVTVIKSDGSVIAFKALSSGGPIEITLDPATLYNISVAYTNSKGTGPPFVIQQRTNDSIITIPTTTVATTTTGTPPTITSQVPSYTSFTLSWTTPSFSGTFQTYEIRVDHTGASSTYINETTTSHTVTGLSSLTSYLVYVRIYTSAGVSAWSAGVTITTLTNVDDSPLNVNANSVASTNLATLTITWSAPQATVSGKTPSGFRVTIKYLSTLLSTTPTFNPMQSDVSYSTYTFASTNNLPTASLFEYTVRVLYSDASLGNIVTKTIYSPAGPITPIATTSPTVDQIGTTTIRVMMYPLNNYNSGPNNYYALYYYSTARRRRRAVDNLSVVSSLGLPTNGRVVYVTNSQLPLTGVALVVGNNTSLSPGLANPPLSATTSYTFVVIYGSVVNNTPALAYTTLVAKTADESAAAGGGGLSGGAIAAIIIGIILLLILLVLLILFIIWWKRRHRQPIKEKPQFRKMSNPKEALPMEKPSLKPRYFPNWSAISNVREPRYLIIDLRFGPADPKNILYLENLHRGKVTFEEEFDNLPNSMLHPTMEAVKRENRSKNLDQNHIPYDHSRVILRRAPNDPDSDYINASYIDGYCRRRAYIVAQAPINDKSADDFWLMICQENASQVVMFGNEKSFEYWPKQGNLGPYQSSPDGDSVSGVRYGNIIVRLLGVDEYVNYTVRHFRVESENNGNNNKGLLIKHYQYFDWSDAMDPCSLLSFHTKISISRQLQDGPMIVHCEYGVSQSGVFVAFDSLLQQAVRENVVNVYKFCCLMRKQRPLMVSSRFHYMFIYDLLGEALLSCHCLVNLNVAECYKLVRSQNPHTKKTFIGELHCLLERYTQPAMTWTSPLVLQVNTNDTDYKYSSDKEVRFHSIIAQGDYAVKLSNGQYINALHIDGVRVVNDYILTETPSSSALNNFWLMIIEQRVKTLVDMEPSCYKDNNGVKPYWPNDQIQQFGQVFVTFVKEKIILNKTVLVRHLKASLDANFGQQHTITVKQYQFLEQWNQYEKVPATRNGIVNLTNELMNQRSRGPILVHCLDGATRSGLFILSHIAASHLFLHHFVDLFHEVKVVKMRRSQVIAYLDQFKFLYQMLWHWVRECIPDVLRDELTDETLLGHLPHFMLESSFTYATAPNTHQHNEDGTAAFNKTLDNTLTSIYGGDATLTSDGIRPALLNFVHYKYVDEEICQPYSYI